MAVLAMGSVFAPTPPVRLRPGGLRLTGPSTVEGTPASVLRAQFHAAHEQTTRPSGCRRRTLRLPAHSYEARARGPAG